MSKKNLACYLGLSNYNKLKILHHAQIKRKCVTWFCGLTELDAAELLTKPFLIPLAAQLLCKGHHHGITKENCYLFKARHRCQWRNHLWLQVPNWRWENSMFMWSAKLSWNFELREHEEQQITMVLLYFVPSCCWTHVGLHLHNILKVWSFFFLKEIFSFMVPPLHNAE